MNSKYHRNYEFSRSIWGCPSWLRLASNNFHGVIAVLILKDIEDLNDYTGKA
jgi:hypothetical protein